MTLSPRRGHTPSDVTVEIPDERIAWCGDLVWNGMFPNYMDAIPSQLSRSVRALQADQQTIYVPGHGPLAGPEDLSRYLRVIDGLEDTARTARQEGWTAVSTTQPSSVARSHAIRPLEIAAYRMSMAEVSERFGPTWTTTGTMT